MQESINTTSTDLPQQETKWISRSPKAMIGIFFRGMAMGASDIVPGVSGGTMAFIFGIYEELINSIKIIGQRQFIDAALRLRIRELLSLINWRFLVPLGLGILAAIFAFSGFLEYFLTNQPVYIWSFFFGLILASVIVIGGRIQKWSWGLIVALIIGAIATYLLVSLVPAQTPNTWWFLMLTGALASCAMILPGISGAYILVMLGKYQTVLSAVNQRDFVILAMIAIGAAIGLVTFAQILSWLFKRYPDYTVAVLIGLLIGSLRKIWPWKVDTEWMTDANGQIILDEGHPIVISQINILPDFTTQAGLTEFIIALALAGVGVGAVLLIERIASRSRSAEKVAAAEAG